jgi:hypothetical protein
MFDLVYTDILARPSPGDNSSATVEAKDFLVRGLGTFDVRCHDVFGGSCDDS